MRGEGVHLYLGTTQVGKTSSAVADSFLAVADTARPLVVIDSTSAWNFRSLPHVATVGALIREVVGARRHCAIIPDDVDAVDAILRGLHKAGSEHGARFVVLVDEFGFWMNTRSIRTGTARAVRAWAHWHAILKMVSQRVADVHAVVWSTNPTVDVFQTVVRADLDALEDLFDGFPRELVKTLAVDEFVRVKGQKVERGSDGQVIVRKFVRPESAAQGGADRAVSA